MAVGDLPSMPRILPSLKQAWTNIWPNFWWLLLFGFLAAVAGGGPSAPMPQDGDFDPLWIGINIAGGLLAIFLGIPLGYGVAKAHLEASRGRKPAWKDLGYAFGPRYWPSIGLGLTTMLIVIGGLILLIVPGIYWAVRLAFTQQRFVEDGLGVRDTIRASFADTKGRWWNVFGLVLLAIPLVIVGLLALVVGVFVALVLISQTQAVYWRSIREGGHLSTASPSPGSATGAGTMPAKPPAGVSPVRPAPKAATSKTSKAPAKKAAKPAAKKR
jgi:hypothetical protein